MSVEGIINNVVKLPEPRAPEHENYICSLAHVPAGRYPETPNEDLNNQLMIDFLQLRKSIFTDEKHWDVWLPSTDIDQYDHYDAHYIISYNPDTQKVLGGARLLCTARSAAGQLGLTYMINDAFRGILSGMPNDICYSSPPVDASVWELTRLVVASVPNRIAIAKDIVRASNDFLFSQKAEKCLFLGSPAFMRIASSLGGKPVPIGPISGNRDGRFLAFEARIVPLFNAATTDLNALKDDPTNDLSRL